MDQEEIVEKLTTGGLNQYQARAYTNLLSMGSASAVALADASGIPNSRIYDVLEDLERKGYVETYEQDSLHARVLDPETVLDEFRQKASSLTDVADAIEELWTKPSVDDYRVTLVKRHETVFERARELIRSASNEIQISVTPEQFYELRPVLQEAFSRGVFVKVVISLSNGTTLDSIENLEFEGATTEVRFRELQAPFLVLIDRSKTCFSPQQRRGNDFGLIVDTPVLTYVFHWYFLTSLWDVWEIIYTTRSDEPPITYVNIRYCTIDVVPLLREGATITVTIDGRDTETNEEVTFTGTITDAEYTGSYKTPMYPSLTEVAGKVSLFVDDGETVHSVGGWFAQIEDISMRRLTIESIEFTEP